jgi:hypothetical protein
MLDRVLAYVRSVLAGEMKGDPAVGRYLMDTLGAGIGTGDLEKGGFNASLQVRIFVFILGEFGADCWVGYVDGVIPRESRTVASGGVISFSPHHIIVAPE